MLHALKSISTVCVTILLGCTAQSPPPPEVKSTAAPPVSRMVEMTPYCVCQIMRDGQRVLVVWSDALLPESVAEAGEIPNDDFLQSLNHRFLPEKVVLKFRNAAHPQSLTDRDHNRVVTLAAHAEKETAQLVVVDYGQSVFTNVIDLAKGRFFVLSIKNPLGYQQMNLGVDDLKFDAQSLAEFNRTHPEIEAVLRDSAVKP